MLIVCFNYFLIHVHYVVLMLNFTFCVLKYDILYISQRATEYIATNITLTFLIATLLSNIPILCSQIGFDKDQD